MGLYKNQGDPTAALAEECAEVIQILSKQQRFNGSWDEVPPGKSLTRWEQLESEMFDIFYQWQRLKDERNSIINQSL